MKDVELQLGIVANQVRIRSITRWSLLLMARDITAQVSQLVKTRHEKMTSADDSRHSIEDDLWKIAHLLCADFNVVNIWVFKNNDFGDSECGDGFCPTLLICTAFDTLTIYCVRYPYYCAFLDELLSESDKKYYKLGLKMARVCKIIGENQIMFGTFFGNKSWATSSWCSVGLLERLKTYKLCFMLSLSIARRCCV